MDNQEILNKAWELKKQANELEKQIADKYRDKIIELSKSGNGDDAREMLQELDWHESIHKFDLIRLIRTNCR